MWFWVRRTLSGHQLHSRWWRKMKQGRFLLCLVSLLACFIVALYTHFLTFTNNTRMQVQGRMEYDGLSDYLTPQETLYRDLLLISEKSLLRSSDPLNMSDWTFKRKRICPAFRPENVEKTRFKINLWCDKGPHLGRIFVTKTNSSSDVFTTSFPNDCLGNAVERYCQDGHTVPRLMHFVYYGNNTMSFFFFLTFLSVLRFFKPCLIVFLGDSLPHGLYWDYVASIAPHIIHAKMPLVQVLNGKPVLYKEHSADFMRLKALQYYGGLYLDFDEPLLREIDDLRQYDHTQGKSVPYALSNGFILAKKDDKFSRRWIENYMRDFKNDNWNYNSLIYPVKLALRIPETIHLENYRMVRPNFNHFPDLFENNFDWSDNIAIHLYQRYYNQKIDHKYVRHLNTTVGSVARYIIYGNKELCL